MKVKDMIQSKWLAKGDFEEDQICTIRGVKLEDLESDGKQEQRWVLYFKEHQKGMVLNVTSIRVLDQAFGDDTDYWKGKRATVYVDPNVSFGGKIVGGLRLRPIKEKLADQQTLKDKEEFNDDVPF